LLKTGMAWKPPPYRKPDFNVLFAVNYVDGRAAYIALSPKKLAGGDQVVPALARELQQKGEIPAGEIKGVKRVR
jgi:hypothetical protein